MVASPGLCSAATVVACSLLKSRKGVDRNSELKQRLHLWEIGTQPQTDEQRGKRACALTAPGSTSKAMKGLVGGAAQGSADCRRNWTTALILRSSAWRVVQIGAERDEGARSKQNRCCFAATRKKKTRPRSNSTMTSGFAR